MNDDRPHTSLELKVCGRRGLVVFCPTCMNWEPFMEHTELHGTRCRTCRERLPEAPDYGSAAARDATRAPWEDVEVPQLSSRAKKWDEFLVSAGPDRLLKEVHILRRALHLTVEEGLSLFAPMTEQEAVNHFVHQARQEFDLE